MSGNIQATSDPDQVHVGDSKESLLMEFRELKQVAPDLPPAQALEWVDSLIFRMKRCLEASQ